MSSARLFLAALLLALLGLASQHPSGVSAAAARVEEGREWVAAEVLARDGDEDGEQQDQPQEEEDGAAAGGDESVDNTDTEEEAQEVEDQQEAGDSSSSDGEEGPATDDDSSSAAPDAPAGMEDNTSSDSEEAKSGERVITTTAPAAPLKGADMNDMVNGMLTGRVRTPKNQLVIALGNHNYKDVAKHTTADSRREQQIKKKMQVTVEESQEQASKLAAEQRRKLLEIESRERMAEGKNKAFEVALQQKAKHLQETHEEQTHKKVERARARAVTLDMERHAAEEELRLRKRNFKAKLMQDQHTTNRQQELERRRAEEESDKQTARMMLDRERIERETKLEEAHKKREFVEDKELINRQSETADEQWDKKHRSQMQAAAAKANAAYHAGRKKAEAAHKTRYRAYEAGYKRQESARKSGIHKRRHTEASQKRSYYRGEHSHKSGLWRKHRAQGASNFNQRKTATKAVNKEELQKRREIRSLHPRWRSVSRRVCVSARRGWGTFTVRPHKNRWVNVKRFRLTHISGGWQCRKQEKKEDSEEEEEEYSWWGCPNKGEELGVFITDTNNQAVAPTSSTPGYTEVATGQGLKSPGPWYTLQGTVPSSRAVSFPGNWRMRSKTFRVWYGEVLRKYTTRDNKGTACFSVQGYW